MPEPSLEDIAATHGIDPTALAYEAKRITARLSKIDSMVSRVLPNRERLQSLETAKNAGDTLADLLERLPGELLSEQYFDALETFVTAHRFEFLSESDLLPPGNGTLAIDVLGERKSMRRDAFRNELRLGPFVAAYQFLTGKAPSCYEHQSQGTRVWRGDFYKFMHALAPHVGLKISAVKTLAIRFTRRKM